MLRSHGMHAPAAIIVNRNAGRMRRDAALAERLREVAGAAATVHVTEDLLSLQAVCASLARRAVATVAVVGGDGTASGTLTALWRAYAGQPLPHIALLRGGTMNTIATSLGVRRRSPVYLLTRLLAVLGRHELRRTRSRPLMVIGERLGFLFGTGVWYGYLAETYRYGPPTLSIYLHVLGRVFASAAVGGETICRITRPARVSVRFQDGTWDTQPYLCIAAGTLPDVGLGFQPFHHALSTDTAYQMLALHGSARAVLRELPRLWVGRGFASCTARQTLTHWAELRTDDGRLDYSVDGDIDSVQGPLRLELGPSFEFLTLD